MVHTHDIIYPGLSNHSIVTAEICTNLLPSLTSTKVIKLYRKVDYDRFQPVLERTKCSLTKMSDIDQMWTFFSSDLQNAVNDYVPKKTRNVSPKPTPVWFTNESQKLVTKQRRLYDRFHQNGDPFDQQLYTKARKETKRTIKKIKKNYIEHRICQPLLQGNTKPFYRHLKGVKQTKNQIKLRQDNSAVTDDPHTCATMLNSYFHSQFNKDHQLVVKAVC